jgi:carbamate kinase
VVTLVTQTVVRADDPAFSDPTKFVGSVYSDVEAKSLAEAHAWAFKQDGDGWRRVVPSPTPHRVVETETAHELLRRGCTVVLAGGGGIPVVEEESGLRGVEAVVDKDLVAGLLAQHLQADHLLVLTDVPAVISGFGTVHEAPIGDVTVEELERMRFPAGSMGPKVAAVCAFVANTGARAAIGSLDEAVEVFCGTAGTQVLPHRRRGGVR